VLCRFKKNIYSIAFGEMQGTDRKPWFLHDPVEGSLILVSQIHGQKMEDFNDGFGLPASK